MTSRYANAMAPANKGQKPRAAAGRSDGTYLAFDRLVVAKTVLLGPRRPRAFSAWRETKTIRSRLARRRLPAPARCVPGTANGRHFKPGFGVGLRLSVLVHLLLATNPGKRLPHIRLSARCIAERTVKDRFHAASSLSSTRLSSRTSGNAPRRMGARPRRMPIYCAPLRPTIAETGFRCSDFTQPRVVFLLHGGVGIRRRHGRSK
jgi:hypothetical protein